MHSYDENLISDLHKDARGFRPGQLFWAQWKEADCCQKQVIWDRLLDEAVERMNEDRYREEAAILDFEAQIAANLELGAADRAAAIRWIVDGLELSDASKAYGADYVCYLLGLPYSKAGEFAGIDFSFDPAVFGWAEAA